MAGATGRACVERTAVGKMAAALGSSGWLQQWRRRLSAWDGSRMLFLLLLLGSGQGPQQVGAGQTFEYLKREHSLSKPYQGEAPRARWSCAGRAWGPELVRRCGGGEGLRGPQKAAGGRWGPAGLQSHLEPLVPRLGGVPPPHSALEVFCRWKRGSWMPLALGLDEGCSELDTRNVAGGITANVGE